MTDNASSIKMNNTTITNVKTETNLMLKEIMK